MSFVQIKLLVALLVRLVFQGGLGPDLLRYFRSGGASALLFLRYPEGWGVQRKLCQELVQVMAVALMVDKELSSGFSDLGLPVRPSR
jgi:hypothetical protein